MPVFTDRYVRSIGPAALGRRDMHWDDALRSFGVRVTDKGSASYVVMRRLNGKLVRHSVGRAWQVPLTSGSSPSLPLAEARKLARDAIADLVDGVDPRAKRASRVRAEQLRLAQTFSAVAEDFIAEHVSKLRSADTVRSAIRQKLVPLWAATPITDITRSEVIRVIRAEAKTHPYAAHHLLAYIRKLFGWAIAQDAYGIGASPCVNISAAALIGEKTARERVLGDEELRAVWRACDDVRYPFGDLARFLILTGQRLRECAEATWSEVDLEKRVWSIPGERMKNGAPHEVPLSKAAVDLLTTLPRWEGPHLFSTTSGTRPVSGFTKGKARLDSRLVSVEPWRFHDLRRTVRTQMGALGVPTNIAEMVIAHAQPGLHRTYDRYRYLQEKRTALQAWADRLAELVTPLPVREAVE